MAQRVNVVLVDDLDGSDAAETVSFGLDGVDYEIDLNEPHAAELREALALYVGHGRRTGGRRRRGQAASGSSPATKAVAPGGATAAEVRAWARENGWDVPGRGRVSADVRSAYDAAH
jgi:Lsr2